MLYSKNRLVFSKDFFSLSLEDDLSKSEKGGNKVTATVFLQRSLYYKKPFEYKKPWFIIESCFKSRAGYNGARKVDY